MRWTPAQVLAHAPDERAGAAARRTARAPRWSDLGSTAALVWGRFQGGARDPYQVTVDLAAPAFRCTCPSRKQPCKHALALLLRWADGPRGVHAAPEAAAFASDWAQERAKRAARTAAASGSRGEADPAAAAKRLEERLATMAAGAEALDAVLADLLRTGLADARRRPASAWEDVAARLVDAQLPALGERVRRLGLAVRTRPDWAPHLLAELGRLHLAARAWSRRQHLDAQAEADLRTFVGWSRRTEEVLAGPRLADRWAVLGRTAEEDERLLTQRTWLAGLDTGEVVVALDFAAMGQALPYAQPVGAVVEAAVAPYPGSPPRRVLFADDQEPRGRVASLPGAATLDAALERAGALAADNPFLSRAPLQLDAVVAVADGDRAWLVDAASPPGAARAARLPVGLGIDVAALLALTGGHPAQVFAEYAGGAAWPAAAVVDGELVAL